MGKGRLLFAAAGLMLSAAATADTPALRDPLTDPFFAADQGDTRGVLILDDGQVVAKRYQPGYSDGNRFISWSMAKTVTGFLVGALVADGKLKLDDPAPIAEWHARPGDPRAAITLRQMMNMSSGLQHVEVGEPIENSDTNQILFVGGTNDMAAREIAKPLEVKPGSLWKYSSLTSLLLAEIVTRQLTTSHDPRVRAQAYRAFAEERLFRPAGITSAVLDFDGAGTQIGGSIIYMSLPDWGRFGMVLLDGKSPDGKTQIVSPDWLAFMKTPAPTYAGYGGQLWVNNPVPGEGQRYPGASTSVASAEGHLGQHVVTSHDNGHGRGVVVVRLGNTREDISAKVNGRVIADALNHFPRDAAAH
ncbi:serine hydrolase domain-containing protein [Sphingomonas sp. GlSt437]|uniref:serine hydrolase domain-containing protein n=1 Tax=Sphingomonas sp. GlSt437 TaxID=3389970 RepID=UPI003A875657